MGQIYWVFQIYGLGSWNYLNFFPFWACFVMEDVAISVEDAVFDIQPTSF